MQSIIRLDINAADRAEIEQRMSRSMGSFIEEIGMTDFAAWTPEQWQDFVATAFDVAALEVFQRRISVRGPHDIEAPF